MHRNGQREIDIFLIRHSDNLFLSINHRFETSVTVLFVLPEPRRPQTNYAPIEHRNEKARPSSLRVICSRFGGNTTGRVLQR
jgi:hypothetical protein